MLIRDDSTVEKWHDGETTPEDKGAGLGEENADLGQQGPIQAANQRDQAGQRLAAEKEMEEVQLLRCPWRKPNAK
jgi:hypothetical protein